MTTMVSHQECPNCRYRNGPDARYCARCGAQLSVAGKTADVATALTDAARSLDKFIKSPAVQEPVKKAGDVARQLGDDLERWLQSEEVEQTRQEFSDATEKLIQNVRKRFEAHKASQAAERALERDLMPLQCTRCGKFNRPTSRFCNTCGAQLAAAQVALRYSASYLSDTGRRRENNEDSAQVWSLNSNGADTLILLIADGMGGQAAGEIASQRVVEIVQAAIADGANLPGPSASQADVENWLRSVVQAANHSIFAQSRTNHEQKGMGTTATLAWIADNRAVIGHVGDSRAYLIPASGPIWQVSDDHTLVSLLVQMGELSPEAATTDEQSHVLFKAVGFAEQVDVDIYARQLRAGDRLLLCSDGLTLHVPDAEIAATVRQHADPAEACRKLVALANRRGGEDNVSVLIAAAEAASHLDSR